MIAPSGFEGVLRMQRSESNGGSMFSRNAGVNFYRTTRHRIPPPQYGAIYSRTRVPLPECGDVKAQLLGTPYAPPAPGVNSGLYRCVL
jgi:hypothetical protein